MNKIQRYSLLLVVLALLFAAPYLGLPVHLQSLLYVIFFWMTLATSWNMLSGYSGYFSFGHGAFFGVGMYGMATLAAKADWPVVPAALGSGVLAALLALAIGALVFNVRKIRGESFALITLAVGFVLATVVVNTPIDGGPGVYLMGVSVIQKKITYSKDCKCTGRPQYGAASSSASTPSTSEIRSFLFITTPE